MAKRPGLYANIHKKRKRIKAGSGEKCKINTKGAPTAANFRRAAKTAKKPREERLIMPGHYGKMKKPKAKNKKLAGMYSNKNKITRGDIIAAAKKRKKTRA